MFLFLFLYTVYGLVKKKKEMANKDFEAKDTITSLLMGAIKTNRYGWFAWWRHQMETFSALLAICAGNSPVTDEFPAQRAVTRSFDVFFDLPEWTVE